MLSGGSGAYATAWSPDGKLMATSFFGSYGNSVQVWDTTTNKLVLNYTGHAEPAVSLGWSSDGKYIASASDDGSTQVWNALTGQKIRDYENNQRGNDGVLWSPVGKTLAYLNGDKVIVANPFTGKVLMTHTGPNDKFGLIDLAWSPDGKNIASAGDHIRTWAVATGKTYYTFTKNPYMILCAGMGARWAVYCISRLPEISASTIQVWIAN